MLLYFHIGTYEQKGFTASKIKKSPVRWQNVAEINIFHWFASLNIVRKKHLYNCDNTNHKIPLIIKLRTINVFTYKENIR